MHNYDAHQLLWDVEFFARIDESGYIHCLLDARDWLQEKNQHHNTIQ